MWELDVGTQADSDSVDRFGWQVTQFCQTCGQRLATLHPFVVTVDRGLIGIDDDPATVSINDDSCTRTDAVQERPDADHRGQLQTFGYDRGVSSTAADFGTETAYVFSIQVGRFTWSQNVRKDDDRFGQIR